MFQTDVVKPLKLDDFIDQEGTPSQSFLGVFFFANSSLVKNLSGGELQRVASTSALRSRSNRSNYLSHADIKIVVLALGLPADIYIIDEPSACESPVSYQSDAS